VRTERLPPATIEDAKASADNEGEKQSYRIVAKETELLGCSIFKEDSEIARRLESTRKDFWELTRAEI
jgi:hypothetical protein